MSYSGLLLAHPMPIPGESLFSFMLRLCDENRLSLLFLLNLVRRSDRYIQSADFRMLDISPESLISLDKLSDISGVEVSLLQRLIIRNLLQTFSDAKNLSRARLLSGLIREEIAYCPQCLNEERMFSILWRFKSLQFCIRHNVPLRDACPECNQRLQFKDVEVLDTCPYCSAPLSQVFREHAEMPRAVERYQSWLSDTLSELIHSSQEWQSPQHVAMKLLYILNGKYSHYENTGVRKNLQDERVLPTILQHARGSLKQRRTLNLNFVFDVLYNAETTINDFLHLSVPQPFIDSVQKPPKKFIEQYSCQAPWCRGYERPGTLVRTGTSVKQHKDGERLSTYMMCEACGCEYAINKHGDIKERTYFVKFYNEVVKHPTCSLQAVASIIGFNNEKLNRCIAFFATREHGLASLLPQIEVRDELREHFVAAIRRRQFLKRIRKWDCWTSYRDFLIYRFHVSVIRETKGIHRSRPDRLRTKDGKMMVASAIRELESHAIDITLKNVSKHLGVCPETIRIWGGNVKIAEAKEYQKLYRLKEKIKQIYGVLDSFFKEHDCEVTRSEEFYNQLGLQRSLVWRISPVITRDVTKKIREHNNLVRQQEKE